MSEPTSNGRFHTEMWFCVLVSVLSLLVASCATMSIPETKVRATESYQLKAQMRGLLVAVHPVTDENEIKETFRTALLDKGILPILVVAENRDPSASFVLAKNKVAVVSRESLERATAQRKRVTAEEPGATMAAVGSVVFSLPLVIAGLKMSSDAQVIERNLGDKEFYSRTVGPGQKAYGYIYFQLAQGTTALEQHDILVEAVDSSTGEAFTFAFPISYRKR